MKGQWLSGLFAAVLALGMASQPSAARENHHYGCRSCGTVRSVESIGHRDNHLGAGTAVGAVVGGVLGNQVGKGDGRKAATVAGAVAGGVVGHQVEKHNRDERFSYRIRVRMDNGRTISVVQRDRDGLRRGDRVRVGDGYVEPLR
ncbi:MAG: glycine zipper 2TM domain-containing protein [Rhodanobacteraceae bacterium]